jgi:tetratricopeptide (TPR) repeat protein
MLVAVVGTQTATAFDEIVVAREGRKTGRITKMSPVEVTLDVNRVERTYPVNEIREINFEQEPLDLKSARRFALSGQYDMALEKLEGIPESSIPRDVILQDVKYYMAYCKAKKALAGDGNKNEAASQMMEFYKNYKSSYHYLEAVELLGDLAVGIGRFDTAAAFYGELGQTKWPSVQLRALVLEGRALLAQGKFTEALAKFEKVLAYEGSVTGVEEQKLFAILGKAACLAETDHEQGISIVEQVIAKGDPSDISLFARAYNTLGKCYLAGNKPKDALIAYLHTHILFYGDAEAHAEALYHLIDLWDKDNHPVRAAEARKLLKVRYPTSVWQEKSG